MQESSQAGEVDSSRQRETPGRKVVGSYRNAPVTPPARGGNDSCFSFWRLAALNTSNDGRPRSARRMSLSARLSATYRLILCPQKRKLQGPLYAGSPRLLKAFRRD